MTKLIWIILTFFVSGVAFSQSANNSAQAELITTFPFKMYSGGVMTIKCKFENIPDSLRFILDTGSGGASLDSATCAHLGIQTQPTDTFINGIGGKRRVDFVFDKRIQFPGLEISDMNFHVLDYSVLTSVYGEKIDGIMGHSFFKRYIVKINFDRMEMEVYTNGKIDYGRKGHLIRPLFSKIPILPLHIKDDRKLRHLFYFDTGAGLCFLLNEKYVADSSILKERRKPLLTQAEGMMGRVEMRLTVIKELKLGKYRFRNVPTYLYTDDYNVTGYPITGGLIGNEILRRFNMTINYQNREIHLRPNSRYHDPFDYAYTGLGIYLIDDKIMVEDIIPGSPADKAGIQIGDELISIGPYVTKNIQMFKNKLQVPGETQKIILLRKGNLLKVDLLPISILYMK